MRLTRHVGILGVVWVGAVVLGCAAGETGGDTFGTPAEDAAPDVTPEAGTDAPLEAGADAEEAGDDAEPEAATDAGADATPDAASDAAPDAAPDATADASDGAPLDGGDADAACPTGYAGPACDECAAGFLACDDTCVDSCSACAGFPVACDDACIGDCENCTDATVACDDLCVAHCGVCTDKTFDCNGTCVNDCAGACPGVSYACDDLCVASCTACTGQQATCETTHECMDGCTGCAGDCMECPPGYHACSNGCHIDVADEPSLGCMYTCDDEPCPVPDYGQAVCTNGACDFTCDTANGFEKSGSECVCDTANGFVADPSLGMCVCQSGMKGCSTFCADLDDPDYGCDSPVCVPCPEPAHSTGAFCNASGDCDFNCDTANGYVENAAGTGCECPSGMVDNGTSCQCPLDQKECNGTCVSALNPDHGCAQASCDPCPVPPHAMAADCSGPGDTCGFVCDTANGYVVNAAGDDCECSAGLIDYGTYCGCPAGEKICGGSCVSTTSTSTGCAGTSCDPCPAPDHAVVDCSGPGGTCSFTCDAAGHWIQSGGQCVCDSGWKDCGGNDCVDATSPDNGCSESSCSACPLPAHATSTNCDGAGGTCDFVCDSAGHWVKSGDQCVCDSGYTEQGGVCVVACPGSTYGSSCYWYVSDASSWDLAESTCASAGGHLASVADSAENDFVRGLAGATFWLGLRDYATISQSVSADDCTDDVWLSGDGGTYAGSTNEWDDVDPCGMSSDADDIFGLNVSVPGVYVLSTANSSFDTMLGLHTRIDNISGYTSCVGSSIECDDDDGPGVRSLIVRHLAAGDYTVIMDGYVGSSGSYVLDVRRFDFVDGTAHGWANWASEEPNNSGGSEDCTEVDVLSGTWNDRNCVTSHPFVCERPM